MLKRGVKVISVNNEIKVEKYLYHAKNSKIAV